MAEVGNNGPASKEHYTFIAGADLSGATNQYAAVKFDGTNTGKVVIADVDDEAIGILLNLPALGQPAEVAPLDGRHGYALADGSDTAINEGDSLKVGAAVTGGIYTSQKGILVKTTTTGKFLVARSLAPCTAQGQRIPVQFVCPGGRY